MFVVAGRWRNDSVSMAQAVSVLLIWVFGVSLAAGEQLIYTKGGGYKAERFNRAASVRDHPHVRQARQLSATTNDLTTDTNITMIPVTPSSEVVTTTNNVTTNVTDAIPGTDATPKEKKSIGGTIIGVIFGVLLGGAILGGGLYLLVRYKRAQNADYNRANQIQMSSTRNAGVYADLAEPSPSGRLGGDYTSLKPQNNTKSGKKDQLMQSDLYEYDSDDGI